MHAANKGKIERKKGNWSRLLLLQCRFSSLGSLSYCGLGLKSDLLGYCGRDKMTK